MKLFLEKILGLLKNKKTMAIAMLVVFISMVSSCVITLVYSYCGGGQKLILTGENRVGDNAIEWAPDGKSFTTLSNDSYMWFDFDDPISVERLVINYKNHSSKPWRVQIYYTTPDMGFSQETSVSRNLSSANEKAALNLGANNVRCIRIDFGDDAGRKYSLDSVLINIVDRSTKIVIFLLVFLMMLALGAVYMLLDTELGFAVNIAVRRLAIKNAIADLLFFMMSIYWLFWEKGGDYILFCNLFLCHSVVSIIDYFYIHLRKGVKSHINCQRTALFIENATLVVIVAALGFLFFNNTGAAVLGVGDDYRIIAVITGIALFIFSIKYEIIENRLHANALLLVIITAVINLYINKNGNFYAYFVFTFYLISALVYQLPERKIVKRGLFVASFFVFLTCFLSTINIYGNTVYAAIDIMKRTLGFLNPNDASFHFLMLTILIVYFNNGFGRIRLLENLFVAVIGLCAIIYPGGRTSIVGVAYEIVIIIGFIIYSYIPDSIKGKLKRFNVLSLIFAQSTLFICCLGSVFWSWIYDENGKYTLFALIGHVFDTTSFGIRLQKANYLLSQYKPLLFGRYIPYVLDGEDLYSEIFYVNALLRDGIILLVVFVILVSIMNIRLWKKQQYFRLLLLAILPIIVLGEAFADNPVYNVFTFLALSNLETREESEAVARCDNCKRPILISVLILAWVIISPAIVAFFITWFEVYNITGWTAVFVVAAGLTSGFIITKTIYNIVIKCIDEKAISTACKARMLALIVVLVAAIASHRIILSTASKQNADNLPDELPVLQLISDNSNEMIYADRLPALYKSKVRGVKYSYRHINDLPTAKNVTLIADSADDKSDFFAMGYLYMPVSDKTAIYTNDPKVESLLQENGYHLLGYNNYVNSVDLRYEAELNGLELNDEGSIVLNGKDDLLDKGPYVSLLWGERTVSFELHMEELPLDQNAEVAIVSVSDSWGQNLLGEQTVTASMFDQNGDCKCDIRINWNGSGYVFKVAPLCDACIQVDSIKYAVAPYFDTHILVDDKGRKIHEEYYDLQGKPLELEGGYHSVDIRYDEAGEIAGRVFYDLDGNVVKEE